MERKLLEGASAMFSKLVNEDARQQCEVSIFELKNRIDFLEGELRKLEQVPDPQPAQWSQRKSSLQPEMDKTMAPSKSTSNSNLFGSLLSSLGKSYLPTSQPGSGINTPRMSQTSLQTSLENLSAVPNSIDPQKPMGNLGRSNER